MIDPFISAIATVLSWIIGVIADIAGFFSSVASSARSIPGVGTTLSNLFTSIQAAFNDFGYEVAHFSTRLQNALNAIDNWLDDLADLWSDVYGWIQDRIDDAYYWANKAWDWVVDTGRDLYDDVYGWITDKLDDAYRWADSALDWIAYTGMDLYRDVYGWITDQLNEAWAWANDAWTWIVDNAPNLPDLPQLVQDAVLAIVGPVFNLVETWYEDISLFFSDPPAYFAKKLEQLGTPFAERLWDIVEKILEKVW